MVSEQMTMVLALLDRASAPNGTGGLSRPASAAAAAVLGVDGIAAGIGAGPQGVALAWDGDAVSAGLENQQFTLGEGPGLDAAASGVPVLVADLLEARTRWPEFAPAAVELGVRAVFAFPLRIGAISVGTMLAHRGSVGPLNPAAVTDALALADSVTIALLDRSFSDADRADQAPLGWAAPVTFRAEVHQATGMISVQLGVSLAEALVRLRAHAWSGDRLLADVAADVVARRLRFDDPHL
jgi:GAF domain-containing protein